MAEHTITIIYDDVTLEYTVEASTLGKSATSTNLLTALAWLCKLIGDPAS